MFHSQGFFWFYACGVSGRERWPAQTHRQNCHHWLWHGNEMEAEHHRAQTALPRTCCMETSTVEAESQQGVYLPLSCGLPVQESELHLHQSSKLDTIPQAP